MRSSLPRFITLIALLTCTLPANPAQASSESLDCLVSRGNLCFQTGCNNSGKTQRLRLDFSASTYRLCPNRYNESGCTDGPMEFDIRENAILGVTRQGPEIAARSVFVNRVTGAFTTSLLTAGGVAAVDFGTCEIQR